MTLLLRCVAALSILAACKGSPSASNAELAPPKPSEHKPEIVTGVVSSLWIRKMRD